MKNLRNTSAPWMGIKNPKVHLRKLTSGDIESINNEGPIYPIDIEKVTFDQLHTLRKKQLKIHQVFLKEKLSRYLPAHYQCTSW